MRAEPARTLLALLLGACTTGPTGEVTDRAAPTVQPGPPVAGMAEGTLDYPMGAPLGGYTGRCNCFGNGGEVDKRDSNYVVDFNPSAGIQTRPQAQALWLDNGDQALVWLRADMIYAADNLVQALEERLTEQTGWDMDGRVILSASHTHNAPANWDAGFTWWLGGDRVNAEVESRLIASLEAVALDAFDQRQPAAIGVGLAEDWDPDDRVYHDRRSENDDLGFFDDIPDGPYKDPTLVVLRVDTAAGDPLGMFYSFAMHGTTLGIDNQMWSIDSIGHVTLAVRETFDQPLIVGFVQSGAGDASPGGTDSGYAQLETIGAYATDAIVDLWRDTPVSAEPVRLETVTHAVRQDLDSVHVTRAGTVDWVYAPYDPDREPDEVVYDDDGQLASPIDEFNTQNGGAFCGSDIPLIPGVSVGSTTYPYSSCIDVGTISGIIAAFFEISQDDISVPLVESTRAVVTGSRLGPLPFREPDGSQSSDDLMLGFFPGEPTALYTEQFRRRAAAELGMQHAVPIGYSQDHEGYLLVPEDWLMGGYEPNINVWGPLQGEYLMEQILDIGQRWLLTDAVEPQDWSAEYGFNGYDLPGATTPPPDLSDDAGTVPDQLPDYLYCPIDLTLALQPEPELSRVDGIAQFVWVGGDPGVDLPQVTLQRMVDGEWQDATTRSGRPVTDALPDILLTHTPDPLYPADALQTHYWWAGWQAVGPDRTGLTTGTYRLHVSGQRYTGGGSEWPWPSEPYQVDSDPFEVVPAQIDLGWDGATVTASIPGPAGGWRMIDLEGSSHGANPLDGGQLSWLLADGTEQLDEAPPIDSGGSTTWSVLPPEDAVGIIVTDAWGNAGQLDLVESVDP